MANSSQHYMGLIAESTYGTTPATPAFLAVRHLNTTLGISKDALLSQELRSDRNISDHQYGVRQIAGDIVMEATYGGTVDTLLEAALGGTWTADVLENGTTRRSFSIMRDFTDITTGRYNLFTGCEVNTFSLQNTANDRIQFTFGMMGKDLTIGDAAPAGATFGSPTTSGMMTGILGSINEGGSGTSIVTEASFTLENGLEIKPVIGSNTTLLPSIGRCNVSGSLTAYFESGTLLKKFVDETSSSLSFVISDAAGNDFTFSFPRIKYTGGDAPVSGQGAITVTLPWQALYDTGIANTMSITRASA